MASMSEFAIQECVTELRAACRRPIDEAALETLLTYLRPNFREILDRPEGKAHWTDHGQQMRDNGRYLGALADFFGHQGDVAIVGTSQLMQAFTMVEAACRVGAPPASQSVPELVRAAAENREPV
jgi:hypothetical protein